MLNNVCQDVLFCLFAVIVALIINVIIYKVIVLKLLTMCFFVDQSVIVIYNKSF